MVSKINNYCSFALSIDKKKTCITVSTKILSKTSVV